MNNMTSTEKAELLKSSISHLYSKEGRSISYISKLLDINRKTVSSKIRELDLPSAEPRHHLTPSNQKFLNKNRNLMKSRLDNDVPMAKIAEELKISRDSLCKTFIANDDILKKTHADYINRMKTNAENRTQNLKSKSSREYNFEDLENEEWKPILGYDEYFVSNKGRIKHYVSRYKSYILLKQQPNANLDNRLYVCITNGNKRKNFAVARLVAHAFVNGFSSENNTVNHKDGNPANNCSDNLEWVSQSENNRHSHRELNRTKVNFKKYKFDKIIYNGKYEFKTVAAFSRFLNLSETQTRRYLDEPEKHNIKLVK
jgi:predicted DNA-binding protein YlxM (UPF0122 family)